MNQETGKKQRAMATVGPGGEVVSERTITLPHTAYSIAGTLAATFGNVLQPLFPVVWVSVIAFGAILGGVFFLKRAGKPVMKGLVGFSMMGLLVSVFLLAVQYAPGSANSRALAQEAGAVAATVPGLLAVQNAVLPIDEMQKDSNRFRLAIGRGAEEDRGAAARAMIDATEDENVRTALVSIALKSDVQSVRQAGLVRALSQRAGAHLPLNLANAESAPAIAAILQGSQLSIGAIDVNTGVATGYMACTAGSRPLNAVAAAGSLTLSGSCYDRGARAWRTYRITLQPDASLGLSGEATIETEKASVSIPLL
jgi:hypothetical protein